MPECSDSKMRAAVEVLRQRGVLRDELVERALLEVPRHWFVDGDPNVVYDVDTGTPVKRSDHGWISSATAIALVAEMFERLEVKAGEHVLEVGTGVGFSTAVLSHLVGPHGSVTSIELEEDLARRAGTKLAEHGFRNTTVICGDGFVLEEAEKASYDRIVVAVAAPEISLAWLGRLRAHGRFVGTIQGSFEDFLLTGWESDGRLDVDGFGSWGGWNRLRGQEATHDGWFPLPAKLTSSSNDPARMVSKLVALSARCDQEMSLPAPLPISTALGGVAPGSDRSRRLFWTIAQLCGFAARLHVLRDVGNVWPALHGYKALIAFVRGESAVCIPIAEPADDEVVGVQGRRLRRLRFDGLPDVDRVIILGNEGLYRDLCSALHLWEWASQHTLSALFRGEVTKKATEMSPKELSRGQWRRRGHFTDLYLELTTL